jgi:hypothetical protein
VCERTTGDPKLGLRSDPQNWFAASTFPVVNHYASDIGTPGDEYAKAPATVEDLVGSTVFHYDYADTCAGCVDNPMPEVKITYTAIDGGEVKTHTFSSVDGGATDGGTVVTNASLTAYNLKLENLNPSTEAAQPSNKAKVSWVHKVDLNVEGVLSSDSGLLPKNRDGTETTVACGTSPPFDCTRIYRTDSGIVRYGGGDNGLNIASGAAAGATSTSTTNEYSGAGVWESANAEVEFGCQAADCNNLEEGTPAGGNVLYAAWFPRMKRGSFFQSYFEASVARCYEVTAAGLENYRDPETWSGGFKGKEFGYDAAIFLKAEDGTRKSFPSSMDSCSCSGDETTPDSSHDYGTIMTSENDLKWTIGYANNGVGLHEVKLLKTSCSLWVQAEGSTDYVEADDLLTTLTNYVEWPSELENLYARSSTHNVGQTGVVWSSEGKIKISAIANNAAGFIRGKYKLVLPFTVKNKCVACTSFENVNANGTGPTIHLFFTMPSTYFIADD